MMKSMGGGERSTSRTGDAKSQTDGGSGAANKQPGPDKSSLKDVKHDLKKLKEYGEPSPGAHESRTPVKTRTEEIAAAASATHSSNAAARSKPNTDAKTDSSASKPAPEARADGLPSNTKDTLTWTQLPPPSLTPTDPSRPKSPGL